jgi:hypothetical protein
MCLPVSYRFCRYFAVYDQNKRPKSLFSGAADQMELAKSYIIKHGNKPKILVCKPNSGNKNGTKTSSQHGIARCLPLAAGRLS